jgi:hypothetical protein
LAIRHLLQIKKLANSDIAEPALSAASLPVPIFLLDRLLLSESMAVCFIRGGNEQFDYIVGNPAWLHILILQIQSINWLRSRNWRKLANVEQLMQLLGK